MKGFSGIKVGLLVALAHGSCIFAQSRPSTPADYRAAEEEHKHLIEHMHGSMESLLIRPDGTRGYTTALAVSEPGYGPPEPSFRSDYDANLHRVFCSHTDAVVIGRLASSETRFSAGEETVFTRYEFAVESTLHRSPSAVIPKTVYIVNLGGSVVKNGITHIVKVVGSVSYTVGEEYLLILRHNASSPLDVFWMPEGINIAVERGRLYPSEEAQPLAETGEPLATFEKAFADITNRHGCR